jgi:hypothetical protein
MLGFFIQKPDLLPWEEWRRGWDTHPGRFRYPTIFSATCMKTAWRLGFLPSRLFQLPLLFRPFRSDFGPRQTPKTPRKVFTAHTRLAPTDRHATEVLRSLNY